MIYVTGDTHCPIDIHKLSNSRFDDSMMTKEDYLVICGDAGFVWHGRDKEDEWWQDWIAKKGYTTLFVDGNHENHAKLDAMPVVMWNGGKVHMLNDSLIHLMRGQVYNINGKLIFTMGGAVSTDKEFRIENKSWWAREMPSMDEYNEALTNLTNCGWDVDYVFTHTAPAGDIDRFASWIMHDDMTNFLQVVKKHLNYDRWFFGHFHDDREMDQGLRMIYNHIIPVEGL